MRIPVAVIGPAHRGGSARKQGPNTFEPGSHPTLPAPRNGWPRVALVDMPFCSTRYPSAPMGLLHAILAGLGVPVTSHYLNLLFAARIGWERYEALPRVGRLTGEWLFSRAAFGEDAPPGALYLARLVETERTSRSLGGVQDPIADAQAPKRLRNNSGEFKEFDADALLDLRERGAPAFIQACLDTIAWDTYDVVGFTSVFQQQCAALAMARSIKQRHPKVTIVFGGTNVDDEMGAEYIRHCHWIDYVVNGEGDEVFPAMLQQLAEGAVPLGMPGIVARAQEGLRDGGRAPSVEDLDALPDPDYDAFFSTAAELKMPGLIQSVPVTMPYESARGCWWGAKRHCTFCGLNGEGMAFRSKSPERVLASIEDLARRHNVYRFEATDSILDPRYIRNLFGPLAEARNDYTFFYEVKASLVQEQLRALARGGVRAVQAGIESLNTHVLKLMRKGTTALQNVRMMKWALYYNIGLCWNLLYGFPGETVEDYQQQLALMQLIPHLPPPLHCGRIRVDRFSPYFTDPAELGMRQVRPDAGYACVYPTYLDVRRIAYYFEYDDPTGLPPEAHDPVKEHVERWQSAWETSPRPYLGYVRGGGRLTVIDGREPGTRRVQVFEGSAASTYDFCGPTHRSAEQVLDHLRQRDDPEIDLAAIKVSLDMFTASGLMMVEDDQYLSLALPVNANW